MQLNPARYQGEAFEHYKARRRAENRRVDAVLRGRLSYAASAPLLISAAGVDSQVDEAVLRGDVVVVGPMTGKDGIRRRWARTKGKTYRNYPPGRDRREWRRMHRENPQPRAAHG